MKLIAWTAAILSLLCTGCASSRSLADREARQQRKAERQQEQRQRYADVIRAVETQHFALEADQVVFKRGRTVQVNANTNFVVVDGDKATVQVAFNIPVEGPNGIGGVTVTGRISNYEQAFDKRGTLHLSMNVVGTGVSARLDITLAQGSDSADIDISPNFHSNRISLRGTLRPLDQARVFQGRAL